MQRTHAEKKENKTNDKNIILEKGKRKGKKEKEKN